MWVLGKVGVYFWVYKSYVNESFSHTSLHKILCEAQNLVVVK
jgi:hypothetical protein